MKSGKKLDDLLFLCESLKINFNIYLFYYINHHPPL